MTHPTYTQQALSRYNLPRLKKIATELGITPTGDKRGADTWVNAILTHQSTQLQKVTGEQATTQSQIVAPEKLTTVVCSFYDHEIYAGKNLIGIITHDDNLTQPWLVTVNGVEQFRANTWARCHRFIQWHLNNSQLPSRNSQLNSISKSKKPCTCNDSITNSLHNCVSVAGRSPLRTANCELLNEAPCPTENRIMAHIFNECEKYGFALLDDGIYQNEVKLGEVGCTDGNWWVIQGSSGQQQYSNSVFDAVRTLSMVDTMPHAQAPDYEELLDRPFEMLTNHEWESLRESAAA